MRYVTVTALKSVVDGRDVRPGEPVLMDPVKASIAARRGEVSLTQRTYQTRHLEAAPVAESIQPTRRRRGRPRKRQSEDAT
jgi:hypothetical protein